MNQTHFSTIVPDIVVPTYGTTVILYNQITEAVGLNEPLNGWWRLI